MPWVGCRHGIVRGLVGWVATGLASLGASGDPAPRLNAVAASALFRVQGWTVDEGLPNNGVNGLLQTHDGFVWVATQNGLARFDGERFLIFDRVSVPAFGVNDYCNDIGEDAQGGLWIATSDGLLHAREGRFTRVPLPDGMHSVWKVHRRREGGMWACADGGLLRVVDGAAELEPMTLDPPGPWWPQAESLIEIEDGQLWVGNQRGLIWRPAPGHPFQPLLDDQEPSVFAGASHLVRDAQGRIWWGRHQTLHVWQQGEPVHSWLTIPQASHSIRALLADRQGRLWWADYGGRLFLQHEAEVTELLYPEPDIVAHITSMTEDREGGFWCGTVNSGVFRLTQRQARTFLTQEGLSDRDVWSLSEAPDGRLWIGTSHGINVYDGAHFTTHWAVPPKPGHIDADNRFRTVSVDLLGRVWAGHFELFRLEDGVMVRVPLRDAPAWDIIRCIYHDRAGATWVGGGSGLYRLTEDGGVERFMQAQLSTNHVINILEDASGGLWVGTYGGGVNHIRNGSNTVYTTREGLLSNVAAAVLADPDGTVWLASNQGLMHYKEGRFTGFTQREGLREDLILNVIEDHDHYFWMNGHRGIQRVARAGLMAVVRGEARTVSCTHIGGNLGMFNPEGNGGSFPNSCRTRDGRLWFPTVMGLVQIDPATMRYNTNPPTVVIQSVKIDGRIMHSDGWSEPRPEPAQRPSEEGTGARILCAPGDVRSLEVAYVGTSFSAPSEVVYEHYLEGYDETWRPAANQRHATYTNLKPGRYVFRVRAMNNHGVWDEMGASVAMVIPPRFHQTPWFYALSGLTTCAALFCLIHYRRHLSNLRLETARRGAMEEQRTRIARDIHDELGATLTSIALIGEVMQQERQDTPRLREQARRISRMAGGAVDAISELVWATNPKYDSADSLIAYLREFAAEFLGHTNLAHDLCFPDPAPNLRVSGEVRRHLHRVLKEALRNIVRHAGATRVTVTLRFNEDGLTLVVSDNGRGLVQGAAPIVGDGLQNIRERIRELGGGVGLESKPGLGTTLTVILPLRTEP